jgi:hypothetical protein
VVRAAAAIAANLLLLVTPSRMPCGKRRRRLLPLLPLLPLPLLLLPL